jgi:hypothetical protein
MRRMTSSTPLEQAQIDFENEGANLHLWESAIQAARKAIGKKMSLVSGAQRSRTVTTS